MPKTKVKKVSEFDKGFRYGYNKGLKDGSIQGFEFHAVCSLYAMKDKMQMSDDFLCRLHENVMWYVDVVRKGFIQYENMKKSLLDVHNFEFVWKD